MSKETFCQGEVLLTSGKQTTIHSFDGALNFRAKGSQSWNAKKTYYGNYNDSQIQIETKDFDSLILRGKRRKGLDIDNKPHADLKYKDYPENEFGFKKLYEEIFWENISNGNNKAPKQISNYAPYQQAAAHARANKVTRKIRDFCKETSHQLFNYFYSDVEYYSMGELEEVMHSMVNKMRNNKSSSFEFSDERINRAVNTHNKHINFRNSVVDILKNELHNYSSILNAVEQLRIKDNGEGKLYPQLIKNKVDSPKFDDKFSGLGIIMNDVWAYEVKVTEVKTKKYAWLPNMVHYSIKLDFIYYDHFGLDFPDLEKKRAPSPWIAWDHNVFWEWFVLQHFRGYVPFITKVVNSHEFNFVK